MLKVCLSKHVFWSFFALPCKQAVQLLGFFPPASLIFRPWTFPVSLLALGPEPQEQGSRLAVAPGLCSCTPPGDVRGLHVLPSVTPSGSALSLIQQVFESLPHLGVWRGQRTESRAQSTFHPWAAGTHIPFPWAPGRAGVHWAVRSPTRAAPCAELWLGPALLPATVSPISSQRRFLLFGAIGMIESITAAKQDVVWVTPSFQQSKVLVFHCLQRDKPHNHRALQGPWGEP